jgi:hypothetical protein
VKQFNIEFVSRDGLKRHLSVQAEGIRETESVAVSEKQRLDGVVASYNSISYYSVSRVN